MRLRAIGALVAFLLSGCSAGQNSRETNPLPVQPDFGRLAASGYRVLYRFGGGIDGSLPSAGVTSVDGVLYGTTVGGGYPRACRGGGCGTVFAVNPTSRDEHVLYRFKGPPDGAFPYSQLIYRNGMFYGTTAQGGIALGCKLPSCGTAFSLTLAGQERVLYRFPGGKEGWIPNAGVVALHGMLYGTTLFGGQASHCVNECGTVFSVDPKSGTERVLHYFTGGKRDGFFPAGALISVSGTLFGTTNSGGFAWSAVPGGLGCCGTVFSISTSGVERIVYRFQTLRTNTDGGSPYGALIDVRGTLYGTTDAGGYTASAPCGDGYGCGTVFAVTQTGTERVVYRFKGSSDGSQPDGTLVWNGSRLYGTTFTGGTVTAACPRGCGTVFSVTRSGEEQVLYRFQGGNDGSMPGPDLLMLNGTLYGVTQEGGGKKCGGIGCGTVFALAVGS